MRTSGLPAVMKDVAARLVADDWCLMKSKDGERSYYIIGVGDYDAQEAAQMSGADFAIRTTTARSHVGPLGEYVVRSQVARSQEDYLKGARRDLEQAGVLPSAIDRLLDNEMNWGELFPESVPLEKRWTLLLNFLEALRVAQGVTELDQEDAREVDAARQKLCLHEIAAKYRKIVNKWEQLERLPFSDPQLEEASQAYLYGFYRAAVVLSASALEKHLKRIVGQGWGSYGELVEEAAVCRGLGPAWIAQGQDVFRERNKVVHDDCKPSPDKAREVLGNARGVLRQILSGE